MTAHTHDAAVLIGRFQPFHRGHAALLERALTLAPTVVIVLGSSHRAPSAKNPFTCQERAAMIARTVDAAARARLRFIPIRDFYNDQRWSAAVQAAVEAEAPRARRVALVGHTKDTTSYYLKLFPRWDYVAAGPQGDYSGTEVRRLLFEHAGSAAVPWTELVPPEIHACLTGWAGSEAFDALCQEYRTIEEGKRKWGLGPFVTVDGLILAAGQVLLVKRKRHPGQGLWALPGGFLDRWERLVDGVVREVREETSLTLDQAPPPEKVVVFDHPDRSQRGRIITHVHVFRLPGSDLPAVKGGDDAAQAQWVPVGDLAAMEEMFFEDHFHILNHFFAFY